MSAATRRVILCGILLTFGFAAQASLESFAKIDRPLLKGKLSTIPMELGDWVGRDEPVEADILKESQASDYINRVYESRQHPGRRLTLWINYSETGLNLRHSPEICLPSGGWAKVESLCQTRDVRYETGKEHRITRLAYSRGELLHGIGFWYYIFGEGSLERYVRQLPITSRSSHGRATRGSGMTVEVFYPFEMDTNGEAVEDFAKHLLTALEPLLPKERADYYIP